MAVTMTLADPVGVARGDMICRPNNQPNMTQEIEATVSWMDAQHTLAVGTPLLLKHTTKLVRATVETLHYRMDINGLRREESATELALNDIGRIRLHTTEALAIDDYQLNRATGSFILINPHTNLTVGAGTVNSRLNTRPVPTWCATPASSQPRSATATSAYAVPRFCSPACPARESRRWPLR